MIRIVELDKIKTLLKDADLSQLIEEGFVAYSHNQVVVPPVGELSFSEPPGDTHIKYGYINGADHFVIKIASGFYRNPEIDLPSNSGLMLVFSSRTGILDTILLDEGYLTDVRTAIAGQIAARYLAPSQVRAIGVLGTGIQARMQVEYLAPVTTCKDLVVWGRTPEKVRIYKQDMEALEFRVRVAGDPAGVAAEANLIITTTPAQKPLLFVQGIKPGTHITAMGSDTPAKQELDETILERSDLVVADSISQCRERGEISKALDSGCLAEADIIELGQIIGTYRSKNQGSQANARASEDQITVADLTGVAIQDIQIATAVCRAADNSKKGATR